MESGNDLLLKTVVSPHSLVSETVTYHLKRDVDRLGTVRLRRVRTFTSGPLTLGPLSKTNHYFPQKRGVGRGERRLVTRKRTSLFYECDPTVSN